MENSTLEEIDIQTGLFLPLSAGEIISQTEELVNYVQGSYRDCSVWTGLGPLQQFNVGAVANGVSPTLRRSYSLSDLPQCQTVHYWTRIYKDEVFYRRREVDFEKLFSEKKADEKKFSFPSFTAPDTNILQSLSNIDPRLQEKLKINTLQQYLKVLQKKTYRGLFKMIVHKLHPGDLLLSLSSQSTYESQELITELSVELTHSTMR